MIQKPAITSLASAKGPSALTGLPPDTRRRVPLEVGWRPSAASSTPALAMSWLNFLIGRTMSGLGTANFSRACAGAGNSIMNRIVVPPSDSAGDRGLLPASAGRNRAPLTRRTRRNEIDRYGSDFGRICEGLAKP